MKRMPEHAMKSILIACLAAIGTAHAQGNYVSAGGTPVRSAYGECWRTGGWTPHAALLECDPQLVSAPAPAKEEVVMAPSIRQVSHAEEPARQDVKPAGPQKLTYATEVLFDFDGAELRAEGRKMLDDLAQRLLASELDRVSATAHADRLGDDAYNERLALRRAEAIRAYLVEKGVPEKQMQVAARGERDSATGDRCAAMGPESRQNLKLVACLQPDRRVEIEAAGRR